MEAALQERHEQLTLSPRIIIFAGLPLSGKSTIARALSQLIDNAVMCDVDDTRRELFGPPKRKDPEKEKAEMEASYKANHEKAKQALEKGLVPILTATYSRDLYHKELAALQKELGLPVHFFLVKVDEATVKERLEKRKLAGSNSNVTTWEHYEEVSKRYQELNEPNISVTVVDGDLQPEENAALALQGVESAFTLP